MEKGFSQNFEQHYITQYFGDRIGKFIDIGAFHVTDKSNTRQLFLNGWEGVLVEPAPSNYKAIADHYKDEPRITTLNVAIGLSNEDLYPFYDCGGDAVSTSDEAHKDKWEQGSNLKFTPITVPQVHMSDFMDKYGKDVNFISIDTEATNMALFKAMPDWVWEQIDCLCIEHEQEVNPQNIFDIQIKLQDFGFKTLYINAENIILGK